MVHRPCSNNCWQWMKGKLPNLSGMIRYYGYRFKQWRDNTLKEIKSPNNTTMLVAVLLLSFAFSLTVVFLVGLFTPLPPPQMPIASEVYDSKGNLVSTFFSQHRRPVKLKEVPLFLRQAVLAVEDHRFYQHKGINLGRILKAAWHDLVHQSLDQGASTITQQLAKNVYLTHERSFSRKIRELFYAIKLEMQFSKDEIFELYLNQIYFGHGAYGVRVAAKTYFRKELNELNEAEMALLAGLPRGPAFYSPYRHSEAARERLLLVLRRMLECGYITEGEYVRYSRQKLALAGLETNKTAPYFMDLIQREVARLFPESPELLYTAGLRIETTLDLTMQETANRCFNQGIPKLTVNKEGIAQPQGVLIAIDPTNGEIRALIGGTDFSSSQFNRAIQAKRQPGSSFKPLLYAAALSNGHTLASSFDLTPKTYYVGGRCYRPTDNGNEYVSGYISLRKALACSSNVVAVRLIHDIGPQYVADFAVKLGIESKLYPTLSLALGTSEVTPLELAKAYLPLANGGLSFKPVFIRRISDRSGRVLFEEKPQKGRRVLDRRVAYLVTDAMRGVFQAGGTAANVGHLVKRPAAGKTGTTDRNRDAWFVGYTPDLLTVVFVGCDNHEQRLPGAANRVAAPIWANFMAEALKGKPVKQFPTPSDLLSVAVCEVSGQLPSDGCRRRNELFIPGTEPKEQCWYHQAKWVEVDVCSRSGALMSVFCRDGESRLLRSDEAPNEVCRQCRGKQWPGGFTGEGSRAGKQKKDNYGYKGGQDYFWHEDDDEEEDGLLQRLRRIIRKAK